MLELLFAAALFAEPAPKAPSVAEPRKAAAVASKRENAAILAGVAVTLECTARISGRVENCQVLGETHPGMGFGEAAVALMRNAQVTPPPRDLQFAHTIQFTPDAAD